jgi:ferredoxin
MRVQIDPNRCRGHARCLTIAPDAFDFLDLEDRAAVRADGVAQVAPSVLLEAEQECPEHAITVGTEPEDEDPS